MSASKSTRKVGSRKIKSTPVHDDASTATAEVDADDDVDEKEGKSRKPEFDLATALANDGGSIALDDNGRLTMVPTNWTSDYRGLGRSAFTSRSVQLQFKLHLFDTATAARDARREELVGKIEEAAVGVSPEKKKLKKAQRLMKQLEQLKAELAAQGVEF